MSSHCRPDAQPPQSTRPPVGVDGVTRSVRSLSVAVRRRGVAGCRVPHLVAVGREAHVATGDDSDQLALAVEHRHAGEIALDGQADQVADGARGVDGDRLADHAALETLHGTDLFGLPFDRAAVEAECVALSEAAAAAPADFFLHRDCQCRNLMVREGRVRFIDFQGGRLGPLAYDLASLLLDPYAALPATLQGHLATVYLDELNREIPYDPEQFRREYLLLALQRNLQILGAFAFLSQVRGKPFFARYLRPALVSLAALLASPAAAGFTALRTLTDQCCLELDRRL